MPTLNSAACPGLGPGGPGGHEYRIVPSRYSNAVFYAPRRNVRGAAKSQKFDIRKTVAPAAGRRRSEQSLANPGRRPRGILSRRKADRTDALSLKGLQRTPKIPTGGNMSGLKGPELLGTASTHSLFHTSSRHHLARSPANTGNRSDFLAINRPTRILIHLPFISDFFSGLEANNVRLQSF